MPLKPKGLFKMPETENRNENWLKSEYEGHIKIRNPQQIYLKIRNPSKRNS